MKCCSNCEWSISPELEDEIIKEQGYKEDDPSRPHAGDCVIGMKHDENYYCKSHQYIEGMEEYENYILYDNKYLGPGYFIITKLDDVIIKFMKISAYGEGGFSKFFVRAYEKDSIDTPNKNFRNINFSIDKNEPLYNLLYDLFNHINNDKLYSIDSILHGKNHLKVKCDSEKAELILSKDIYGVKHATDFIDILLGDNDSCKNYKEISNFYNELSKLSIGKTKEEDIRELLLTK